jgi:hypothetical protein
MSGGRTERESEKCACLENALGSRDEVEVKVDAEE